MQDGERVHPHPGMPRRCMMTQNVRGIGGLEGLKEFLRVFQMRKKRDAMGIICAQEHNLHHTTEAKVHEQAKIMGCTAVISFGRADAPDSERGGVIMVLDNSSVVHKDTLDKEEGFIRLRVEWGTQTLEIATVYAPTAPVARVDFFNHIKTRITRNTIIGGDWNTVGDKTLDVNSSNPLQYRNHGGTLLAHIMADKGLVDERREQLGNEPEYTRIGNTRNGLTSTRLDRWYTPADIDSLLTFNVDNTFVFKKVASDHRAVILTMDDRLGETGKARKNIDETLLDSERIQDAIAAIVKKEYDPSIRNNRSEATKWLRVNNNIKDFLFKETDAKRKRARARIEALHGYLAIYKAKHKSRAPVPRELEHEKRIHREIFELRHPEVTKEPTAEKATYMRDRAEVSTKAMFATYQTRSNQQWINKVKKADWQEGVDPQFAGTTEKVEQVGGEFVKLYKMIFAKKDVNQVAAQDLYRSLGKKRILKEGRERLDAAITVQECLDTMEDLPIGKQAGPNRIPNAVYKRMSTIFAEPFCAMMNETRRTGKIPKHFLEGDIAMLYKKGDREDPRNYRPITLLNTDYKIFTRILSKRMCTVVHQFVSESQKGFVPGVFIAEATMLLNLVEAHINEEPDERQGIFLFLDMEKAFDRVSYEFTNKGLEALGFGKHFKKWVKMMYSDETPPKRRMYVNGHYSEWFHIRSGVAQGCPLSPLLFLICAEALNIAVMQEKRMRGIEVNGTWYKISQFADDTTLMLGHIREEKYATRALNKWCAATGMRENVKKREGLAMGKYRGQALGHNIKWAPENGWCVSLGVPIGNDLDAFAWWSEKLNKVRVISTQWLGLKRAKYFGRNLIVQGCFYGRLRYWLYSVPMNKRMCATVQKDADVLSWSREPQLETGLNANGEAEKNGKRIRRWVARETAIAPREQGGLNMMDWEDHAGTFQVEWITRYVAPGEAAWKTVLDSFLLYDKKGKNIYPEGRQILFMNLNMRQKAKMLDRLPRKAEYMRGCLTKFWKLKIAPDPNSWKGVESESPWHGHRFRASAPHFFKEYAKDVLDVHQFSDFINRDTNRPFTFQNWKDFVETLHEKKRGIAPPYRDVIERAHMMMNIQRRIPQALWREVQKPKEPVDIKPGVDVYLIRGRRIGRVLLPARILTDTTACHVRIDATGIGHAVLTQTYELRFFEVFQVQKWKGRWSQPRGQNFVLDTKWKWGGVTDIRSVTPQLVRKVLTEKKQKKPASEERWKDYGLNLRWEHTWELKSQYTTPRDTVALLQLQHRNLYVAKSLGLADQQCRAHGCGDTENQTHLFRCRKIQVGFWEPVNKAMKDLGFQGAENNETYWIGCQRTGGLDEAVTREEYDMIAMAWRNLYAETVKARMDDKTLNLKRAIWTWARLVLSRVKAYGNKWHKWYVKQRLWQQKKTKTIPEQYRKYTLIEFGPQGDYYISSKLRKLFTDARDA